jgi:hypothetical protein
MGYQPFSASLVGGFLEHPSSIGSMEHRFKFKGRFSYPLSRLRGD